MIKFRDLYAINDLWRAHSALTVHFLDDDTYQFLTAVVVETLYGDVKVSRFENDFVSLVNHG